MNRKKWGYIVVVGIIILTLLVVLANVWKALSFRTDKIEILCEASAYSALEHFEEYNSTANDSDYIAGVAEFRTYMRAYLILVGESDTNYIWCNILYGDMTLHPEKVKAHIPELLEALDYLTEDYNHPNGFNLINALNNKLREDK